MWTSIRVEKPNDKNGEPGQTHSSRSGEEDNIESSPTTQVNNLPPEDAECTYGRQVSTPTLSAEVSELLNEDVELAQDEHSRQAIKRPETPTLAGSPISATERVLTDPGMPVFGGLLMPCSQLNSFRCG